MRNLVKGNLLSRIMIIGLFKLQLVIVAKEEGYEKRMMNKKLTIRGRSVFVTFRFLLFGGVC